MDSRTIEMTMQVHDDAQACEFDAAWREIVTGSKIFGSEVLEQDTSAIIDWAQAPLDRIEKKIRSNPTAGQSRRQVDFLAAINHCFDYSIDLTDLRTLDTELANACLDHPTCDRVGKREVHSHLAGGARDLIAWIEDYALPPRRTQDDAQAEAFARLVKTSERTPNSLLREAIDLLLAQRRAARRPAQIARIYDVKETLCR